MLKVHLTPYTTPLTVLSRVNTLVSTLSQPKPSSTPSHRRSTILLPAPPGLEDVVEERKAKYMVWLESDEEDSSSEDESSSDE